VNRIVLDSGALIALERNDRAMWATLKLAASRVDDVLVPSTALAQVWRGTRAQARLAKALQHCVIASFDDVARAVGELCGRTRTADICDAHVAIVAATHGDVLYTSDPGDMRRLTAASGRRRPVIVPC
jgi:predicted nucleic acid-binding protein